MNAPVLVTGLSGTVGSEVARALLARGVAVRTISRTPSRVRERFTDVEIVAGDLADPEVLRAALHGARAMFYVSPHETDEVELASGVIAACEHAGTRLVFMGVHIDGRSAFVRGLLRTLIGWKLPHYRPKFDIAERARRSSADAIVLVATNFFQNDEAFREELLAGEFPLGIGPRGVNRVDVRDIAEVAARACADRSLSAGAYTVVGPESISGPACADVWSVALGRSVRFTGADGARRDALLASRFTGKKRDDLIATYRALISFAVPTDPRAVAATTTLLGHPPRCYAAYVRETVASWYAREVA